MLSVLGPDEGNTTEMSKLWSLSTSPHLSISILSIYIINLLLLIKQNTRKTLFIKAHGQIKSINNPFKFSSSIVTKIISIEH